MPRWLVTGGTGYLGRWVLERLRAAGLEGSTFVLGRRRPASWPESGYVACDLLDHESVRDGVAYACADYVIHAAGRTPPSDAETLYRTNTFGTDVLLRALENTGRRARVVVLGSAAELGPVPERWLPASETTPCRPADAYGLSKWAATRLALAGGAGLDVMVARVFNLIGPGMPANQALGRFARVLAAAPRGAEIGLDTGELSARRDFVDVRDAAEAVFEIALRGRGGRVYHIGTGCSRSIGEGLDILTSLSGLRVTLRAAGGRRGPADSRADIGRIVREIGWQPTTSWERSLGDLWSEEAGRGASVRVVA
jgi:GDP-4-dehydro-6-deoxy-D-mannose reductase